MKEQQGPERLARPLVHSCQTFSTHAHAQFFDPLTIARPISFASNMQIYARQIQAPCPVDAPCCEHPDPVFFVCWVAVGMSVCIDDQRGHRNVADVPAACIVCCSSGLMRRAPDEVSW